MRPVAPALWLSPRGVWVLLALALAVALASLVPALAFAVWGLGAVVVAAFVADVRLGPSAAQVSVERTALASVTLRRTASVAYAIENRAPISLRLGLVETPIPTIDFAHPTLVARVGARARTSVAQTFLARERGPARFGPIYAWVDNRVGLVRRRFRIEADARVRVLPDLSAVERYGTLARRSTLLDAGLRRMRGRGAGSEFESLREYAPGDAFRTVDWKATARRGRLMVAQYDVEKSQQIVVALDCGRLMTPRIASPSGGPQRKFDFALTAALSAARIAEAASDNVGLLAFAATPLLRVAPRRGSAHVAALARAAYDLQPRFEEPDYEAAFADLRARLHKRSLIVLFTDVFDPVTSAAVLAALGGCVPRHLAMCVLMNDGAVEAALAREPTSTTDAYRAAVALTLAEERARSLATLRARGIIVVDVPASRLTVALLDAYLDVKARGLL